MTVRMCDVVLVGGGLQSALAALALLERPRPPSIAIIERGERLGGNHTWCFHEDDVPAEAGHLVAPLVVHRWGGHQVLFPSLRRRIGASYAAITSERLDQVVQARVAAAPGSALLLGRTARAVHADRVELADGEVVRGRLVIEARGPSAGPEGAERSGAGGAHVVDGGDGTGYQKFVGLELALEEPHQIDEPILMDATVAQLDGFRFVYVLPLRPDRVLIEDTYFADGPALDRALLRDRALAYARARGLGPAKVVREEHGVLPMPWRGDGGPRPARGPLVAGIQGGWFHPATGYSLPVAVRLAALIGRLAPDRIFGPELSALAARVRRQAAFARQLNRLLFRWCTPDRRWEVLARFYRLPEATIRRFYALDLRPADAARILIGRPPGGLSLRTRLGRGRGAELAS